MAPAQAPQKEESERTSREPEVRLPPGAFGFLAVALVATSLLLFLGSGEKSEEDGAGRTDQRDTGADCLDDVAPLDVKLTRSWRSFWRRLDPADCRPGSWLVRNSETGQTLEGFRAARRSPLSAGGHFELRLLEPAEEERSSALLSDIAEFVGIYFQESTLRGPGIALPAAALRPGQGTNGQYDATALLESLQGACSSHAIACLAITDQDLSAPGLHYLFGLGQQRERVGVMSTHRLREAIRDPGTRTSRLPRESEVLRRVLKVAVHEVGHQLGLAHCRHFSDCMMAGSASLGGSDRSHLMLCPLEHEKLEWQLGFVPQRRFSELAQFAAKHRLHKEAAYWSRMAEAFPRYPSASGASAP